MQHVPVYACMVGMHGRHALAFIIIISAWISRLIKLKTKLKNFTGTYSMHHSYFYQSINLSVAQSQGI